MKINDFIEKSSQPQDIDTLYKSLESVLAHECGYDRVIFSLMSDHASLKLPAGHGIMRNYPDDWMRHYIAKGYEHIDPVRRFGFRSVGPFVWDSLPLVMNITEEQKTCMNESKEAGFYNGAAVCLRGAMGEIGGIGVAMSSQKKLDSPLEAKRKLSMLNIISHQFYSAFCHVHNQNVQSANQEVVLTKREVQVVGQMALGKKDMAIAHELNITNHAVHFHTRNILKKFQASNRIAAVIKAVNSGIVAPEQSLWIRQSV